MCPSSIQEYIGAFLGSLKNRCIDFVLSEDALGCKLTEVYITEAQELVLFPLAHIDIETLRWILEIRTPLKARMKFFIREAAELKNKVLQVVSELKAEGIDIPNAANSISVHELTETNLSWFLDSLENWSKPSNDRRSLPLLQTLNSKEVQKSQEPPSSRSEKHDNLYLHLRNAIKTYWTQRYLTRYLNIPSESVKELSKRIGIQCERCGSETLYFFERSKALETYFKHIIKGILDELSLQYREASNHVFFLSDLHLVLYFFDGEKEQLKILAREYADKHNVIIVVPETLRRTIDHHRDDFFQILPLDQEKIKRSLQKMVRQRIDFITAYSSGITN